MCLADNLEYIVSNFLLEAFRINAMNVMEKFLFPILDIFSYKNKFRRVQHTNICVKLTVKSHFWSKYILKIHFESL